MYDGHYQRRSWFGLIIGPFRDQNQALNPQQRHSAYVLYLHFKLGLISVELWNAKKWNGITIKLLYVLVKTRGET